MIIFMYFACHSTTPVELEYVCVTGIPHCYGFICCTDSSISVKLTLSFNLISHFSFLLEKSGANIALEQKLSKSGPVFSK